MDASATLTWTVVLLAVFQVKHYLADFPLQREYMLRKTLGDWSFVAPLSLHCGVHAGLTLAIVLYVEPSLWWLAIFDFVSHFIMDRFKASPRFLGRYSDVTKRSFWNCFGIDQMVHHLCSYYIIWELVKSQM
tara:strand:+ start:76 stop:471 length:396 start_codon:yes stop_codon:yes gene_type:complete